MSNDQSKNKSNKKDNKSKRKVTPDYISHCVIKYYDDESLKKK